jgi:hypothetical protein
MMIGQAQVQVTSIFAKKHAGKDVLVYEAALTTPESNAMVLPIPILAPSTPIELLDLSAFPRMFSEIALYYNGPGDGAFAWGAPSGPPQKLAVFSVGSFKASIVPSLAHLDQIDARFQIHPGFRQLLADRYGDWAFVVYQLAPGNQVLHPFGVTFESRFQEHLFFPALHVHDGVHAPAEADFAHYFYAQGASLGARKLPFNDRPPLAPPPGWDVVMKGRPFDPGPRSYVPVPAMPDFVDLRRSLDSVSRFGIRPNADLFFTLED